MKPWTTLDKVDTPDGVLELRQRDTHDVLITVDGRVLMTSTARRSEEALGAAGCRAIAARPAPRVLIGGLGMGYTLRAALDALPPDAVVTVAELNPVVERWCRGPISGLTDNAVADHRVTVVIADVMAVIAAGCYDAILVDLYIGPGNGGAHDPLYGKAALAATYRAVAPGGVYAIWGESVAQSFVRRLERAGFAVELEHHGRGGFKHVVYLARR